jgi:hypothetical protein
MVAVTWAVISLSLGLLAFAGAALIGAMLPAQLRTGIARWYWSQAMTAFGPAALVWRDLGGPELMSMAVDDEEKVAKATLSSGVLSDDKDLPFRDPDNRMHRLGGQSLAVVPEAIPAVVDAEVAEMGHWHRQHRRGDGLQTEDGVNPWVDIGGGLRAANPLDAVELTLNGVRPESINSARKHTQERFAKYGRVVGVAETAGVLTGFGAGAFGMLGLQYFRQQLLGGGGGSTPGGGVDTTVPIPPGMLTPDQLVPLIDHIPLLIP